MSGIEETQISKAILEAYHRKLTDRICSDVIIVGAGPAGMTAGIYLARSGLKVTILEKRLSPGGGIWGGGIGMNEAVVQDTEIPILEDLDITYRPGSNGLHTVDTVELAAGICFQARKAGVVILNLMMAEDVRLQWDRVTGVVVNRTSIGETLPVDPITFSAWAVIDATGHQAAVVDVLCRRGLLAVSGLGEGPMDAVSGEAFVVEKVAEVYPGLWVCGMSTCAVFGGPRMGPIFGGMLRSGRRVSEVVKQAFALAAPLLREYQ
jgi:thiamine thiazole synthase